MNIINKFSTGLLSTTLLLFQNHVAQAQNSEDEIKSKAQAITVEVVSISVTGSKETVAAGSGVLVKNVGNLYFVLTNQHVIEVEDDYAVFVSAENIIFRQQYILSVNKKLPSEDLALLTFESTSEQKYDIADIADPNSLSTDELNYVSGFPSAAKTKEKFKFIPIKITDEIVNNEERPRGYKPLTYATANNKHLEKGMSGGSILNNKGELIGIHQGSEEKQKKCKSICVGIPIEIIQNKLALWQIPETSPVDESVTKLPTKEEDESPKDIVNKSSDINTKHKTKGYGGISFGGFFPDDDLLDTSFGGSMFFGGKFTKNIGTELEFALLRGGTEFDDTDYTIWSLSINPKFFLPLTKKTNAPYLFFSPGVGISQADVEEVRDTEDKTKFTWQTKLGIGLPINKWYEGFAQIRYASQTGENALDFFSAEVGISIF